MLFCRKNVENNFFEKMYLHKTKEIVTNKESVCFSTIHCQSERVCKNFRTPTLEGVYQNCPMEERNGILYALTGITVNIYLLLENKN